MEITKQQILDKGYTLLLENEHGCAFYKKDISFCVLILKEYSDKDSSNWDELYEALKKEVMYIKKTLAVILNTDDDKDSVQEDPYYFAKIFQEQISLIPSQKRNITINLLPMQNLNDIGDYYVDPLKDYDGKATSSLLDFLVNKATDNCVIKYPRLLGMEGASHIRYIAEKLVDTINYEK